MRSPWLWVSVPHWVVVVWDLVAVLTIKTLRPLIKIEDLLLIFLLCLLLVLLHIRRLVLKLTSLKVPRRIRDEILSWLIKLLHSIEVLVILLVLGAKWLENFWRCLRYRPPASDCLYLLYLNFLSGVFLVFLTVSSVFFIHIQNQLLNIITSLLILVIVARTYA